MNNKIHSSTEMEQKLERFFNTPTPDPAFAARLERTLVAKANSNAHTEKPARASLFAWLKRPAWNYALALIVVLAVIIAAAGPTNVLAKVKQLFAPGVGFVEPGVTRVLTAPVEVRQGDVILRVESAVASPKNTQISLTASGLPKEKFGPEEGPQSPEFNPYLLLPDGTRLNQNASMSGMGDTLQAILDFPPLPENINQVTLILPRLPSLPAGFAPDNWSVPLELQVVGEQTSAPTAVFPAGEGYTPSTQPASVNSVTAQILQVGQTDQEMGLQIQYKWDNPEWKWMNDAQLSLTDETDKKYARHTDLLVYPDQDTQANPQSRTYRFDAFDKQARQARLAIDYINFTFTSPAHFTFDPNKNASAGQTWDLSALPGSQINLAGVPVQVLSATISAGQDAGDANQPAHYHLDVVVQANPQNGLSLQHLSMSTHPDLMVSSSCEHMPDNQFRMTIDLPQIPSSPLTLYFPNGEVRVTGPWQFEWNLP